VKKIQLPSGKTAVIKDGQGKNLLMAQRIAGNPDEVAFALTAELVEIDGQKIVFEDILEMPLADVIKLQAEVTGDFLSVMQEISLRSQKPQAGDSQK
jgi:ethanolamine utilization cobalamin adenosyltransferase